MMWLELSTVVAAGYVIGHLFSPEAPWWGKVAIGLLILLIGVVIGILIGWILGFFSS